MRKFLFLALCAALAGPAVAAGGRLEDVIAAPLRSADPAKPIEVLAAGWWIVADGASEKSAAAIGPEHLLRIGDRGRLGPFPIAPGKGPVTLVVDYGGVPAALTGASGAVRIGVECMDKPLECAIPLPKTAMLFQGELLSKLPIEVGGNMVLLEVGRQSHSYALPGGDSAVFDLEIAAGKEMTPKFIKAWLIHGENAADVVPGQVSRSQAIYWIIGAGAALLLFLLWRLHRR